MRYQAHSCLVIGTGFLLSGQSLAHLKGCIYIFFYITKGRFPQAGLFITLAWHPPWHPRGSVNTGCMVLGKHSLTAQGPRALNHVVKWKCWYLITSINLGGISSLESRPPVRGKIKSYVCRKYYTRLPPGKIFISLPVSSLYFSYLSGVWASKWSFCILKIHHIKMRTQLPCCEKFSDDN